ncbi:head-tail adaptor protein [Sphingomonas sp. CARO-RG-8B-R24-01]|uniref:head-tail adaptor protein n=1 Tax=Sphingomonas sp. CARO-RG-8B-R24-01 TaxID=2914831 RepID=UPI001F57724C
MGLLMALAAGSLNRRIRIEKPVADSSFDGAGSGSWQQVTETRASVQDMLPSRSEKLADGLNIATRPSRVRIRYREDISASMRVLVGRYLRDDSGVLYWQTTRVAQITTVPAEIGNRDGLEFMVEDYSTAGNPA